MITNLPLAPSITEGPTLFVQWTVHSDTVYRHKLQKPIPDVTAE